MIKRTLATVGLGLALTLGTALPAHATSVDTVTDSLSTMTNDLTDIATAAGDQDTYALSDACASLSDHANDALAMRRPRILPRSAWRHMRLGWTYYAEAGDMCEQGADHENAAELESAVRLLKLGNSETDTATVLLKAGLR
jgi:hypothetical protein